MLILAGPGSGKTKVVVHRCAYLLRVERVRPQSVLVCCFNRHASVELRRRLYDLVGDDARGVTVLTYHALAMRLLGFSFSAQAVRGWDLDLDALIPDATKLLRGEKRPAGVEADEIRDRLLAGFQYILVDEYQDINKPQYQMISAIAGRTINDANLKLSILAVGDDDQNIYTFRGANVRFIRQFQQDYEAEVHYLVENYRSTRCIIDTANELIAANLDRMKSDHPIRINRQRAMLVPGGEFERRDSLYRGRLQIVEVADDRSQAPAVVAELHRLRQLGVTDWARIAVLSREHDDLARVRTLAEAESIPIRWAAGRNAMPALHQVREINQFLSHLSKERSAFKRAGELRQIAAKMFGALRAHPWVEFLNRVLDAWEKESGNAELPVQEALEFLYEACAESRREFSYGEGVTLSTVHAAKGTEYDHVLVIGPWRLPPTRAQQEEERRTFYVGLTRARKTLAAFDRKDIRPSLPEHLDGRRTTRYQFIAKPDAVKSAWLKYEVLSLEDIHLGYPGQFGPTHRIHRALAALHPQDVLQMKSLPGNGMGLFDAADTCVARLSSTALRVWSGRIPSVREVRILALVRRSAEQDPEESRRKRYLVPEWEVPVVEVVTERS